MPGDFLKGRFQNYDSYSVKHGYDVKHSSCQPNRVYDCLPLVILDPTLDMITSETPQDRVEHQLSEYSNRISRSTFDFHILALVYTISARSSNEMQTTDRQQRGYKK